MTDSKFTFLEIHLNDIGDLAVGPFGANDEGDDIHPPESPDGGGSARLIVGLFVLLTVAIGAGYWWYRNQNRSAVDTTEFEN